MLINSENFPTILEAMHCMEDETMGPRSLRLPVVDVPDRWKEYLPRIEEKLKTLSRTERDPMSAPLPAHVKPNEYLDSQWYTFLNGEYHDMQAMENRDAEFGIASLFFNDSFEGWSLTSDDPKMSPQNVANIRRLEWLEEVRKESATGLLGEQLDEHNRLQLSIV